MKNIEQHFLLNIFCIFYWFVSKHLSSASCIIHCIWICLKCLTFNSLTVFWMSGIVHTWLNYWEIIGVNSVEGGGGLLKKNPVCSLTFSHSWLQRNLHVGGKFIACMGYDLSKREIIRKYLFTSFQKHLKHKSQTEIGGIFACMCNHQHLHLTACQSNKSFI